MADIFDTLVDGDKADIFDRVTAAPRLATDAQPVAPVTNEAALIAQAVRQRLPDPTALSPDAVAKATQFSRGTAGDRAAMFIRNFLPYAAKEASQAANSAANLGIRGAGPAIGQAVGAATGPLAPIAAPVLGALGGAGGEALAEMREGNGMKPGAIAGAALVGAVPGGSLASAGAKELSKEAIKNAAANLTAKATQTYIDEHRLPNAQEIALAAGGGIGATSLAKVLDRGLNPMALEESIKAAQDATRRETLKIGRDLGYVLPPSVVRPNIGNDTLNSLAGKAATAQQAVKLNQPITNAAVREELGIAQEIALSPQSLNSAKIGPMAVYGEVASISPQAKIKLEQFKQAQADANMQRAAYRNMPVKDPNVRAQAEQFQKDADAAFKEVEKEANQVGKSDLIDRLQEARKRLAKIGVAENALNKATGDIDATLIGKAYDAGEKLTGNFEKIGRFQQAFSQLVKDASNSPPSGVHQLLPFAGGALGTLARGPEGGAAALGAFMVAPQLARQAILSKPYQSAFVNYGYGATRQDVPAMIARFAAQSATRQPPMMLSPQAQATFAQPQPAGR